MKINLPMQTNADKNRNIRHNAFPVNPHYSGIYSHGVEVQANSRQLWLSGQIGVAPDGSLASDFKGQFQQAMTNVEANLKSASMSIKDIVQMRFYLVNRADLDDLVAMRKQLLDGLSPAVTTYFVAGLVDEKWHIEIEVLACKAPQEQSQPIDLAVSSISKFAQIL